MFNVGDKVVIVKTEFGSEELQPGNTGVVIRTGLTHSGDAVVNGVKLDSGFAPFKFDVEQDDGWNFYNDELELVA